MTVVHKKYEYEVEEGKVYQLERITSTNVRPTVHITGTGSLDMRVSVQIPSSISDPILTLGVEDEDLIPDLYQFNEATPNFIKFEANQAGTRTITLSGFKKPTEIIF